MKREELENFLRTGILDEGVRPLNKEAMKETRFHWDHIAKPIDGLGTFEKIIVKIAGIQDSSKIMLHNKAVITMCADNGIVDQGVSQSGMEVTSIVSANMAKGIANICKMSGCVHTKVIPVDIGIANDIEIEGLIHKKVRKGTRDFIIEPAMTKEETTQAIFEGIEQVRNCKEQGYHILATGEMGIGNTTTSSAMTSILLNKPVEEVTGRGAGLDDKGLLHKQEVIQTALSKYKLKAENVFEILQTVGGLDIAGLTGVFLGGMLYRMPIVIDGIISAVAALTAYRLCPLAKDFMIASHMSKEPAMKMIMEELELEPVLYANLALGEGTGAVMLFPLLDMANAVYQSNTTFSDIAIEDYKRF